MEPVSATISVITMMHDLGDREYNTRRKNFSFSLKEQTTKPDNIVIVDTTNKEDRRGLFVTHFPQETFNKCRAFNYGLSLVDTDYVMFTDIDFMFHPRAIEKVMETVGPGRFILGIADYLKETPPRPLNWGNIARMEREKPREKRLSPGTIQVAEREWFVKVGGYDERYEGGLGGMDDDMKRRAGRDKLEVVWIEDRLFFHQPHIESKLKGKCSKIYFKGEEEKI